MSDKSEEEGATPHELLMAAARTDNEDMIHEVFDDPRSFDINYQDGLGNTALHYAASHASLNVLEEILSYEGCDVDLTNRLEGATPLHLALQLEDHDERMQVLESLLDAGANPMIKDKAGQTVTELASADPDAAALIRKATAQSSIADGDVAADDDEDDEEGSGSGSGSDE